MARAMTIKEIYLAARLLRSRPIQEVIETLQCRHSEETIRSTIDNHRLRRRQRYQNTYARRMDVVTVAIAPPEVMEKRDERARLYPQTITALVFGDPLPGFSALDEMRAAKKCDEKLVLV